MGVRCKELPAAWSGISFRSGGAPSATPAGGGRGSRLCRNRLQVLLGAHGGAAGGQHRFDRGGLQQSRVDTDVRRAHDQRRHAALGASVARITCRYGAAGRTTRRCLLCLETQTIDAYLPRAGGISPRLKSRLSNKSAINLNPGSTTAGAACVSSAVGGAHRRWRALAARRCARPAAAAHLPVQKSVGCAGVPAAGGCIPSHTSKQILDQ
jgi:hypothetical protein